MPCKPLLLTFLSIVVSSSIHAQLIIGTPTKFGTNAKEVDTENLRNFKNTTTVFFYNEENSEYFEEHGDKIKQDWHITPLIFAPVSESEKYAQARYGTYSFFSYYMIGSVLGSSYVEDSWTFLDLKVPSDGDFETISRLALGPETKDAIYLSRFFLNDKPKTGLFEQLLENPMKNEESIYINRAMKYLQTKASFTNLYPGIFRHYLKYIDKGLSSGETRGIMDPPPHGKKLADLAKDTLIVPEDILLHWDKKGEKFEVLDPKELFSKYDYQYKILSLHEINELFLGRGKTEGLFIMVPALSSQNQFINIYTPDGEWIYSDWDASGNGFKARDMKKISKKISKAAKD